MYSTSIPAENLATTERHLDVSKGHSARADDLTDELKQLNRSIFRPVITFNKESKRAAQEAKVQARYEEERSEREKSRMDVLESQNRILRAQAYDDAGAASGSRWGRFRSPAAQEERKRMQFEATESDDEIENQLDDNLHELDGTTKLLKSLGVAMGQELDRQNDRIATIDNKAVSLDGKLHNNTQRVCLQFFICSCIILIAVSYSSWRGFR